MMKKSYRPGKSKKRRAAVAGSLLVVAMVVLLFVFGIGPPQFVRSTASFIARPFLVARDAVREVARDSVGSVFLSQKHLVEENSELKKEARSLQRVIFERNRLKKENRELKSLLGRSVGTSTSVLADVLSRPPQTPYDTLLIDMGAQTGSSVFLEGNIILGEVVQTMHDTAQVRLFSSPGVNTEAFLEESEVAIVVRGEGAGNFIAQLPTDVSVQEGDVVVLPGIEHAVLGIVSTVERVSGEVFQTIRARVPFGLQSLREVFVR